MPTIRKTMKTINMRALVLKKKKKIMSLSPYIITWLHNCFYEASVAVGYITTNP